MSEGPEWFAPKRVGYGAGLPIAWQGWAVLGAYFAVVGAAAHWLRSAPAVAGVVVPATALLVLVAHKTTRGGGWRWRW